MAGIFYFYNVRYFSFLLLSLVILFVLVGCSIKKRSYRDGYYVSWHHKKNNKTISKTTEQFVKYKHPTEKQIPACVTPPPVEAGELATLSERLPVNVVARQKISLLNYGDECGDVITFRKGSEVKAKVLEINETQIKYKKCDNIDGPLITVNKNDVYSIKYVNGLIEHFDKIVPDYKNKAEGEKEVHPLAYVTLGCTIAIVLLNVFALVAALIVGTIAKQKIAAQPGKYEGLEMVKICMTVCWILLILGLVLTIILVGFFLAI
jgi:hypothetical protein